jgi:glycosyltransferase involved in cell wall biosynthesis
MRKKIWANVLVFNEENFLWFAVSSVVNFVDKILLWDTGSTDKTLEVIQELKIRFPDKINFKQVGRVDKNQYTTIRQQMLDETKADWLIILDGDEIWWDESIRKITDVIRGRGQNLDSIVVPFYNCIGDIYHYQEEKAGKYKIDGQVGHLTVKAINRNIKQLHLENPYGQEGYFDDKNTPIQERDKNRRIFLGAPFMHVTHLQRTKHGSNKKLKHELGKPFSEDFKFPEVFYKPFPSFVNSPFIKRGQGFLIKSSIYTLPRAIKRKIYG